MKDALLDDALASQIAKKIVEEAKPLLQEFVKEEFKILHRKTASTAKVVDYFRTELEEQGKDYSGQMIVLKGIDEKANQILLKLDKGDSKLIEKMSDAVESKIEDTVAETVPNAVESVVEPVRHKLVKVQKKGLIRRFFGRIKKGGKK